MANIIPPPCLLTSRYLQNSLNHMWKQRVFLHHTVTSLSIQLKILPSAVVSHSAWKSVYRITFYLKYTHIMAKLSTVCALRTGKEDRHSEWTNLQHSDQQNAQYCFLDIYIIISLKLFLHVGLLCYPSLSTSAASEILYTKIQHTLYYKQLSTFWLFNFFTSCLLCTTFANLVLCSITLVGSLIIPWGSKYVGTVYVITI